MSSFLSRLGPKDKFSAKFCGRRKRFSILSIAAKLTKKVTFKPSCFLLVNSANPRDQPWNLLKFLILDSQNSRNNGKCDRTFTLQLCSGVQRVSMHLLGRNPIKTRTWSALECNSRKSERGFQFLRLNASSARLCECVRETSACVCVCWSRTNTDAPETGGFPWFPPTRISMQRRLPGNRLRTATHRLTTEAFMTAEFMRRRISVTPEVSALILTHTTTHAGDRWRPDTSGALCGKHGYTTDVNKHLGTFF